MTDHLTPDAQKAIDTIQKLLNLAAKAGTPEEAAAANAKAQELLVKFNLSSETLGNAGATSGAREKERVDGGFYQWQRDVWKAVAELNFCLYWSQKYRTTKLGRTQMPWDERADARGAVLHEKSVVARRHALVGRKVNVRATLAMAKYLEDAIGRITSEAIKANGEKAGSNWAGSFRRGAADAISERLYQERHRMMKEERERDARAREAAAGAPTGQALTIAVFRDKEYDANIDFMYGEGTAAKWAAERAESAAQKTRRDQEYTAWAAANPEEAAKREKEAEEKAERAARRYRRDPDDKLDGNAYWSGVKKGREVSLAPQAEDRRTPNAPRIGRAS